MTDTALPDSWTIINYGIPTEATDLRNALRRIVKGHGLVSLDLGGSYYVGPKNERMDAEITALVEKIRQRITPAKMAELRTKGLEDHLVNFVRGTYDQPTASFFRSRVVLNVLADLDLVEKSVEELEKAMAGTITLKDKDGKPRNLLTTGYSRLASALETLEQAESVTLRLSGSEGLEKEAERIYLKIREARAWTEKVSSAYERWSELEKARAKSK